MATDVAAIPAQVWVGPHPYEIAADEDARVRLEESSCYGRCHYARLRIELDNRLPATMLAETLLHEILHAAIDQTGQRCLDTEAEEALVSSLSPILYGVLTNNDELLAFLLGLPDPDELETSSPDSDPAEG